MPLSWNEIRDRAMTFSREWATECSEDAEAKSSTHNLPPTKSKKYPFFRSIHPPRVIFVFDGIAGIILPHGKLKINRVVACPSIRLE